MAARIRSAIAAKPTVDEQSREDLAVGDVVTVTSLDAGSTYAWTLEYVPEGSAATMTTPAGSSSQFTVDLEGPYLVKLVVDGDTANPQYVRLRFPTVFADLRLPAATEASTTSIPVDADTSGWADDQNRNLQTLAAFVKRHAHSGRILFVDGGGTTTHLPNMPFGSAYPNGSYGDFQTIQAAVDYAVTQTPSAAAPWVIVVHPGTYNEDVTFAPFVDVVGLPQNDFPFFLAENPDVIIKGFHSLTCGDTEATFFQGIRFENDGNSTSPVLTLSTSAGTGIVSFRNCAIAHTDTSTHPALEDGCGVLVGAGTWVNFQETIITAGATLAGSGSAYGIVTDGASTTVAMAYSTLFGGGGILNNPNGLSDTSVTIDHSNVNGVTDDADHFCIRSSVGNINCNYSDISNLGGTRGIEIADYDGGGPFTDPSHLALFWCKCEDITFDAAVTSGESLTDFNHCELTNITYVNEPTSKGDMRGHGAGILTMWDRVEEDIGDSGASYDLPALGTFFGMRDPTTSSPPSVFNAGYNSGEGRVIVVKDTGKHLQLTSTTTLDGEGVALIDDQDDYLMNSPGQSVMLLKNRFGNGDWEIMATGLQMRSIPIALDHIYEDNVGGGFPKATVASGATANRGYPYINLPPSGVNAFHVSGIVPADAMPFVTESWVGACLYFVQTQAGSAGGAENIDITVTFNVRQNGSAWGLFSTTGTSMDTTTDVQTGAVNDIFKVVFVGDSNVTINPLDLVDLKIERTDGGASHNFDVRLIGIDAIYLGR